MKLHIKRLALALYGLPPFRILSRMLRRRHAVILTYHHPEPGVIAEHLEYLRGQFTFATLEELDHALREGDMRGIGPGRLILTFDDGWRTNLDLTDALHSAGARATIFLTTGLIGTHRRIWNYTLDREGAEQLLNEQLKRMPDPQRREYLKTRHGDAEAREYASRDMLNEEEIVRMAEIADLESHTRTHPVLSRCDEETIREELTSCRADVFRLTGRESYYLAYPYGESDARVRRIARESGFRLGRGANNPGLCGTACDPFNLPSVCVPDDAGVTELRHCILWAELCHLRAVLSRFLKGSGK